MEVNEANTKHKEGSVPVSIRVNDHTVYSEDREGGFVTVIDIHGEPHKLRVKLEDVLAWKSGAKIQNALHYLSADDRELMISGIPGEVYDAMFAIDEDEDVDVDEDSDSDSDTDTH